VFIRSNGATHSLWRAVDQDGAVLDILVQPRRNAAAARKFFRKLLKRLRFVPRVVITDKLARYRAAMWGVLRSVEHRRHKGLNNRAENFRCWPFSPSAHRSWQSRAWTAKNSYRMA